jgi:hypothetical protein
MFFDMGYRDDRALDRMVGAFLPWLRHKMESGEYLAWLTIAARCSGAFSLAITFFDGAAIRRVAASNSRMVHQKAIMPFLFPVSSWEDASVPLFLSELIPLTGTIPVRHHL